MLARSARLPKAGPGGGGGGGGEGWNSCVKACTAPTMAPTMPVSAVREPMMDWTEHPVFRMVLRSRPTPVLPLGVSICVDWICDWRALAEAMLLHTGKSRGLRACLTPCGVENYFPKPNSISHALPVSLTSTLTYSTVQGWVGTIMEGPHSSIMSSSTLLEKIPLAVCPPRPGGLDGAHLGMPGMAKASMPRVFRVGHTSRCVTCHTHTHTHNRAFDQHARMASLGEFVQDPRLR